MKPLSFIIKDLRLVKDLEVEFPKHGLVLIKGKNNTGKSTAINAFKDLISANNTTSLVDGVSNGSVIGTFALPSGEKLTVRMDMSESRAGSRFILLDENGKKKTKIGDIQDLFKYNPFTIEEFIDWGAYAEGRRKQRNIFLDVLGVETKVKFLDLDKLEQQVYTQRTEANNQELMLTNVVEKGKPAESDFAKVAIIEDISNKYQELEKEYLKVRTDLELKKEQVKPYEEIKIKIENKEKEVIEKRKLYTDRSKFYEDEITELYKRINKVTDEKIKELAIIRVDGEKLSADLKALQDQGSTINAVDISEYQEKEIVAKTALLECKNQYDDLIKSKVTVDNYNTQVKYLSEAKKKAVELDNKIKGIRLEKDTLVINSPCPIKDIRIVDDGLELNVGGRWLPLDIKHVSQSKLTFAVVRINVEVNKHLPVILVSRGESYDSDMLKEFLKLAKETDSIFLIERVEDNISSVQCEIIIE